jgi:hypothetical protein
MPNLGRQISDFMHDLIPPGSDAESIGLQVSAEVKALLPLSPIEPFGTTISGFVQIEGPGLLGVSNFVDGLLPPSPVEPPATLPSPIEPFGTLISGFVQTLEGPGPLGVTISNFVDGLLSAEPRGAARDTAEPIDPDVIRDLVLDIIIPGANPGTPDLAQGSVRKFMTFGRTWPRRP